MIVYFQSFVRTALVCVCFAALVPSQKRSEEGLGDQQAERLARAKAAMAEQKGLGDGEEANLTPEERLARNVSNNASAYCRFVTSCKPAKLLPGQSGMLYVTALLQGSAVLPAPAPIEVVPRAKSNPITLGALSVQPPESGKFAKAYVGRPVYDNYAVFEVPVTMGPEAKIGEKHGVFLDLKFDLYDGNSAQPVGRFVDRVATEIEVGLAPDPAVLGGVHKPAGAETPESRPVEAAEAPTRPPVDAAPDVVATRSAEPAQPSHDLEPQPPANSDSSLPTAAEGGEGLPMPMLLGGGVFVLAILALLLRKRS